MRLTWGDTELELRGMVARLLDDHLASADPACQADHSPGFDRQLMAELDQLGLVSLRIPTELGGGGSDAVSLGVVLAEMGKRCVAGPYLTSVSAIELLLSVSDPWARALLADVASGRTRVTAGPVGDKPLQISWRRPGRISSELLCEWGEEADVIVLAAQLAGVWMICIVDPTSPGVSSVPVDAIDDVRLVRLRLESVLPVEVSYWREETATNADPWSAVAGLRGAELIGVAEQLLTMTLDHVKNREQFGASLAAMPVVQHRCADAAIALEGARLAMWEHLWRRSRNLPVRRSCASACFLAGRAAEQIAVIASLLHGGVGYIVEHQLPRYFLRAKGHRLRLGSTPRQLDRIAETTFVSGGRRWAYHDPRQST
jgi:alkylation response protein AidB-like acyl-CoA dehydrogenase